MISAFETDRDTQRAHFKKELEQSRMSTSNARSPVLRDLAEDPKSAIYDRLPRSMQPFAEKLYYKLTNQPSDQELHEEFVQSFFDSTTEYERYINEAEHGEISTYYTEGLSEYRRLTEKESFAGVGLGTALDYYALVRKLKPTIVVETGVCNGVSTLAVLLALKKNEQGTLHSIDYPFRADESLEEFQAETFDGYGGAAIPNNKNPGWIIPEALTSRWELTIGKSQQKLPETIVELEEIDMFIHDSEHSEPCMMFEYELAYEHLNEDGVVLSDDITWNDAFSTFISTREGESGYLQNNVGYIQKSTTS